MIKTKTALCLFSTVLFAAGVSSPSRGDQTDPALGGLFTALQSATEPAVIRNLENQIWEKWLAHANPDVQRLMVLGTQRMNAGLYREALLVFTSLTESFPEYAEAWNKRATVYYALGELQASVADIEKTLALEPRHFGALSGLGLVFEQQEKLTLAREAFLDLLEVHPNSPSAQQNLRRIEQAISRSVV